MTREGKTTVADYGEDYEVIKRKYFWGGRKERMCFCHWIFYEAVKMREKTLNFLVVCLVLQCINIVCIVVLRLAFMACVPLCGWITGSSLSMFLTGMPAAVGTNVQKGSCARATSHFETFDSCFPHLERRLLRRWPHSFEASAMRARTLDNHTNVQMKSWDNRLGVSSARRNLD